MVLLEQIRTLDKSRLREAVGQLDGATMDKVNGAIAVSFRAHTVKKKALPGRSAPGGRRRYIR